VRLAVLPRHESVGSVDVLDFELRGELLPNGCILEPHVLPIRLRCWRAVSITPQALALMTAVTPPDWA
jgi:hypothetical protein